MYSVLNSIAEWRIFKEWCIASEVSVSRSTDYICWKLQITRRLVEA